MAYMFKSYDEDAVSDHARDDTRQDNRTDSRTTETRDFRNGLWCVFGLSLCLLPVAAPVGAFGIVATGVLLLATIGTAENQRQIDSEIKAKNFGCAWLWWLVMVAFVIGAAYVGIGGGLMVFAEMAGR